VTDITLNKVATILQELGMRPLQERPIKKYNKTTTFDIVVGLFRRFSVLLSARLQEPQLLLMAMAWRAYDASAGA
jgi:hypothetical protein